jgi:hypothetical protein
MMQEQMRRAWLGMLLAVPAVLGGCATGAVRQIPDRGKLTVGVTTTGGSSPSNFHLTIEPAGISGDVKADAGVFINDHLPEGEHVVRLALPANCRADAGTERKITISPQRRSAVLRFEVRCS